MIALILISLPESNENVICAIEAKGSLSLKGVISQLEEEEAQRQHKRLESSQLALNINNKGKLI